MVQGTQQLFSVIIVTYRQLQMLYAAIDSVLNQDYPSIQLIVADDGTEDFPAGDIEAYIEKHKGANILAVSVYSNSVNLGTVRSLNQAHRLVKGAYVLHFAGDDCLAGPGVLSDFAKELDSLPETAVGVSARSL